MRSKNSSFFLKYPLTKSKLGGIIRRRADARILRLRSEIFIITFYAEFVKRFFKKNYIKLDPKICAIFY